MSSNAPLGPYVIAERVGTSVWLAEDTRSGKKVAVKLLTKSLPKDQAKRDALIREVRIAAALYHVFVVPILEIVEEADNLLMIMEVVEGKALTRKLRGTPVEKQEFFRLAFQLASALKYLHIKGILHGNITGDSVMVTPEGHLRLGGLNMNNLLRREKTSREYQQKGMDPRTVSYLAPEMISASSLDERSDVFEYGVVLYEMATGKLPFPANEAPDIARLIVEGQPVSPRTVNANIDNAMVGLLGGCLFKDPFKRHKEMKSIVDAVEKYDYSASEFASQLEKKIAPTAAASVEQRRGILFVADVANYDDLAKEDPSVAAKAAAQMQQLLGEAVYLFDGTVLDPFGTRMVAEMPSVDSALEAGRKAEFDLSVQEGEQISVRMLLHAGSVEMRDGVPAGSSVEKALETLAHVNANQLFISEAFVKEGRGNVRLRDYGARAGVKLYTIVPPEPAAPVETEVDPSTAEMEAEIAAEVAAEAAAQSAAKKKKRGGVLIAAIAAVIVLAFLAGAVAMFLRRGISSAGVATNTAPAAPSQPTAANPRTIHLAPFVIEGTDPTLQPRAQAIQLATESILRTVPELRLAPQPVPNESPFSANVRVGTNGPELLPTEGVKAAPPVALLDAASGIRALVGWVLTETHAPARALPAPEVLNSFADAVAGRANGDDTAAEVALRLTLVADPAFLPAQLFGMDFFDTINKPDDALASAKQVAALDPSNLVASRKVARAALTTGDLQQAFAYYAIVLKREPNDLEALNHVARYSTSIADATRFAATLEKLKRAEPIQVAAHEPDMLTAGGRIDAAIQRYYTIEETLPNSPSLSLKIGRLAVLRHSLPIAELELKKLSVSDPLYGFPMLSAYIAAERQDKATAMQALERALTAAVPGDDSWTCAAEVHAILADTAGVITSLEKAAQRKEPTAAYVLAHPLFRYLENDARFQKVRDTLTAQQSETRTALAQLK
ncbi:MAG TPA: protein kinase [Thermoanaerobaculia bacterium]|nr:protein kinase [Thermoanaerobaculia bacterium]